MKTRTPPIIAISV